MNKTIILTSIWALINSGAAFAGHGYDNSDATDPVKTPKKKTSKKTSVDQTPTQTQGYNENATAGQKATPTTTGQKTVTTDKPTGGTEEVAVGTTGGAAKKIKTTKNVKKCEETADVRQNPQDGTFTITFNGPQGTRTFRSTRKVSPEANARAWRIARTSAGRRLAGEVEGGTSNPDSAEYQQATAGGETYQMEGDGPVFSQSWYARVTESGIQDPTLPNKFVMIKNGCVVGGGGGGGGGAGEEQIGQDAPAPGGQ